MQGSPRSKRHAAAFLVCAALFSGALATRVDRRCCVPSSPVGALVPASSEKRRDGQHPANAPGRPSSPLGSIAPPISPARSGPDRYTLNDKDVSVLFDDQGVTFSILPVRSAPGWGVRWGLRDAAPTKPRPK